MPRYKNVTEQVDHSSGEVTTVSRSYTLKQKSAETYIMVFRQKNSPIYQITRISDLHIYYKLCEIAEYNTNRIRITAAVRQQLLQELGPPSKPMNSSQFSNGLQRLSALRLITGTKGDYYLNPQYSFCGHSDAREKLLEKSKISQ